MTHQGNELNQCIKVNGAHVSRNSHLFATIVLNDCGAFGWQHISRDYAVAPQRDDMADAIFHTNYKEAGK